MVPELSQSLNIVSTCVLVFSDNADIELGGPFSKKANVDSELAEVVAAVIAECLEPAKNGLTPPSD